MNDIVIRPFEDTPGDRARVDAFFASLDYEGQAFFNRFDINHLGALRFFTEHATDVASNLRLMALDGERMVGYVSASEIGCGVPGIAVAVSPDCQGKGVGKKMLGELWRRLREKGAGGMWLCCHQANIRAQMLYRSFGFEHMGNHSSGEVLFLYRGHK